MRHAMWAVVVLSVGACGTGTEAVVRGGVLTSADEGTVEGGLTGALPLGTVLRTTSALNLRSGSATTASVRMVLPQGAQVVTVGSTTPSGAWYQVAYKGVTGYSHGGYLQVVSTPSPSARAALLERAKASVGFSYWLGHGRWIPNGATSTTAGVCTGDCPDCVHQGSYGADCSGYIAKLWNIPSWNTDPRDDAHPYNTRNFMGASTLWRDVPREAVQPGDALVYNDGQTGHIVLFEAGDAWGELWTYEARGCVLGIVHNLRTLPPEFKGIARVGY